jgi:hypothetical protein
VATRPRPDRVDLDPLRRRAGELHRQANAGAAEARSWLRRHLQLDDRSDVPLHLVRLAIARSRGFRRWPAMLAAAKELRAASRDPLRAAATGGDEPLEMFLRHAVLLYGPGDGPERWATARRINADHPELAATDLYAAAALADHEALTRHLSTDSDNVNRPGGPFGWAPLLYLTYSRVRDDLTLEEAEWSLQTLLDHRADPDAGFLWRGQPPPFTALTGLFGGGEQGETAQPAHPYAVPLARLLLAAGADPNDGQTLYHRMFGETDEHLELLFAHGLGQGDGGPWRRRLGDRLDPPEAMVRAQLTWAITHGQQRRIRLLADHGVDLAAPLASSWLPTAPTGDRRPTPVELAIASGRDDVGALLVQLGAPAPATDVESQLAAALLRGDEAEVERLIRNEPARLADLRRSRPSLVLRAVVLGRPDAVRLLVRQGFDVNARGRQDLPVEQPWETALHHAAGEGAVAMTELLLSLGAATDVLDDRFRATPLGWARFFGQAGTVELLEPVSPS